MGRQPRSGTCRLADRCERAWPSPIEGTLTRLPGVRSVEIRGERVLIQTTDSDAVARYLLTATTARDVEIVAHNLEDAFLTLTGDESTQSPPDPSVDASAAGASAA